MKLLLICLLLSSLCTLSSWSVSSGTLVVTQTPDVSVVEGDTVNISCCWSGHYEQITVNWLKNQTQIKNESSSLKRQSVKKEGSNCLNLTLSNITTEDSGRYICKLSVEIPVHVSAEGNGTEITVGAKETQMDQWPKDGSKKMSTVMIAAVAVVVPLFLITLICFCILRRKQAGSARVIYEVPHIDSDVADMDKHNTSSSTGSSQWCQVPVYESFDYFEHMQPTKETG